MDRETCAAFVSVNMWITCPKCNEDCIDLMDIDSLNDEAGMLRYLLGVRDNLEIDFDCPRCSAPIRCVSLVY